MPTGTPRLHTVSSVSTVRQTEARAYGNLGWLNQVIGRLSVAAAHHSTALSIALDLGDLDQRLTSERALAEVCHASGDTGAALSYLEQALVRCRQFTLVHHEARTLAVLGRIQLDLGDLDAAGQSLRAALALEVAVPSPADRAEVHEALARLNPAAPIH